MKIIFLITLSFLFTGSFFSCSKLEQVKESSDITITMNKFDTWINLMPGGPPSFHFAGDISITYTGKDSIDFIKMTNVSVSQDNKKLYDEVPYYNEKRKIKNVYFLSEQPRDFLFGSEQNIKIVPELDTEKPVTFVITFESGELKKVLTLNDIKVERVY
jgi:hypothetical protein